MNRSTHLRPHPAAQFAAGSAQWRRVQDVVGPLAGLAAPLALYLHDGLAGEIVATPTGLRRRPVVPAGRRVSFGSYVNAFPATQWSAHVGVEVVRLGVEVDGGAVLTVLRSDGSGTATVVEQRLLAAGVRAEIEISITETAQGGLVWFDLRAGAEPVQLVDAAWAVAAPARPGGVVLGMPTTGRVTDVGSNLARIAEAPALLAGVDRIVVVDHAADPIAGTAPMRDAAGLLGDRLRVVRQPNLGGLRGFSRILHEAAGERAAAAALLLDDDIVVEPAALLKAVEFGRRTRRPGLVGLQMLDAARPGVLDAAAERIEPGAFWWGPADARLAATDVAVPIASIAALHRSAHADFAGWWGCLVPLEVVERIGYALPLFLKWDDAEYALRAQAAGFGTVSLTGAAVWHESWRTKDDARNWPAYFHARNRVITALVHGRRGVRTRLLCAGFAQELKQLLAHQVFAVERRHEGLAAVLDGPQALPGTLLTALPQLLALAAIAPDQRRLAAAEVPEVAADRRVTLLAPDAAPSGARLGVWAAVLLLRHLVVPARTGTPPARLADDRGTWWVLPRYDDVLTPTADRAAYFHVRREPGRFRRTLLRGVGLHVRLWLAWPRLRRQYRAQAPALASRAAWAAHFGRSQD